jgi:hypothetical protein
VGLWNIQETVYRMRGSSSRGCCCPYYQEPVEVIGPTERSGGTCPFCAADLSIWGERAPGGLVCLGCRSRLARTCDASPTALEWNPTAAAAGAVVGGTILGVAAAAKSSGFRVYQSSATVLGGLGASFTTIHVSMKVLAFLLKPEVFVPLGIMAALGTYAAWRRLTGGSPTGSTEAPQAPVPSAPPGQPISPLSPYCDSAVPPRPRVTVATLSPQDRVLYRESSRYADGTARGLVEYPLSAPCARQMLDGAWDQAVMSGRPVVQRDTGFDDVRDYYARRYEVLPLAPVQAPTSTVVRDARLRPLVGYRTSFRLFTGHTLTTADYPMPPEIARRELLRKRAQLEGSGARIRGRADGFDLLAHDGVWAFELAGT